MLGIFYSEAEAAVGDGRPPRNETKGIIIAAHINTRNSEKFNLRWNTANDQDKLSAPGRIFVRRRIGGASNVMKIYRRHFHLI